MKMRTALRSLALAAALTSVLSMMGGCAPADSSDAANDPAEIARRNKILAEAYPMETKLTNSEGKVIKVTITGRTKDGVVFMTEGSKKETTYPLSKLSKEDRRRIGAMPEGRGPAPESPYVATRRKAIADNERRIREAYDELKSTSIINTTTHIKAKEKQIENWKKENSELENQIKSNKIK